MTKKTVKLELKSDLEKIKKSLGEKCACFVLIRCTAPCPDGKMEVEMDYEGDEGLAAYLIESAGQIFDEKFIKQESK